MSFLFTRARRMFAYGDLGGPSSEEDRIARRTSVAFDGSVEDVNVVHLESSASASATKAAQWRRKRRRIAAAVALFGLIAIVLVAVSVKGENGDGGIVSHLPKEFSTATKLSRNGKNRDLSPDGGTEKETELSETVIKLDDIFGYKFQPVVNFNATWLDDEEFMFVNHHEGLLVANVRDQSLNRKVMSASAFNYMDASDQFMSVDKKYLMLQIKAERLFRRSTIAEYLIFPLEEGKVGSSTIKLRPSKLGGSGKGNDDFLVRHASFAPRGNGLAYVDVNSTLFYRRSVVSQDEQLSEAGVEGEVYNGVADWVFEEEVFEDTTALWWAPDGQKLVWGSFNDSAVEKVLLQDYGSWMDVRQYPFIQEIAYPKAGTTNPRVQLWLSDMRNDEISKRRLFPPRSLDGEEVHFSWVAFVDEENFAVQWMNRVQNRTVVTLCNTESLQDCQELFSHQEPKGWIDYKYRLTFDPKWKNVKGKRSNSTASLTTPPASDLPDFVTILSDPTTKHKYRQVLLISPSNKSRTYLTNQNADVVSILSWSPKDDLIYFLSPLEGQPGTRHIFRVGARSGGRGEPPVCTTCNRTDLAEKVRRGPCEYHEAQMSTAGSYFALTCLGPIVPYTCIHETASDKLVDMYEENADVIERLADVDLPSVRNVEVPVPGSELKAQVKLYYPPGFDPGQKYPMLVYVYGGPGQQYADVKYDQSGYQTYLSGSKGFIYAIVDPMGSGQQGDEWLFSMNRGFGTAEVNSTIEVVRYLQQHMSSIDANRTAIWGWSYGGFLSLSVLGHDHGGVFACGASVAPVVDWTLYDTYYTERYMGLPHENKAGYNSSRVFWYLENLRTKPFLLMHGTKDDNVHYQQSLLLSAALAQKDILFHQHSYPDQDHQIALYLTHVHHTLTDFLLNDCFVKRKTKK